MAVHRLAQAEREGGSGKKARAQLGGGGEGARWGRLSEERCDARSEELFKKAQQLQARLLSMRGGGTGTEDDEAAERKRRARPLTSRRTHSYANRHSSAPDRSRAGAPLRALRFPANWRLLA